MSGEAVTEDSGTVTYDADDVSFGANVTITARYAAVVVGTVAAKTGTDALVGYTELDTGGDVSSTNGSFDIDWSQWLADGETISSSSFAVTSPAQDITIDSDSNDDTTATVELSGGFDGRLYRITNTITTSSARTDDQSIWVRAVNQ
jgi:hypothetical protein